MLHKNCCENCFQSQGIIKFIQDEHLEGDCDYCQSTEVNVCPIEDVGCYIRECIGKAYEHLNDGTGAYYDSEESCYSTAGKSVFDILIEEEVIFDDTHVNIMVAEKMVKEMIRTSGPSDRDIMQGAQDNYRDIEDQCLVLKNGLYGSESTTAYSAWEQFKFACMHFNRYFDIGGPQSDRGRLLSQLEMVFNTMQTTLNHQNTLIRARSFELEDGNTLRDINAYKETSPAPIKYAPNNRMSPAGISYMYLADSLSTCLQEIRATIGSKVIVGNFNPKKDIKVLDLSIKPQIPKFSIFDENYDHDLNWIDEFIQEFKWEISKPISDIEKDLEYVPTQVLAEYIRQLGYHGIVYESSLVKGTYNYVLFFGPDPELFNDTYDSFGLWFSPANELPYFHKELVLREVHYYEVLDSDDQGNAIEIITDIPELKERTYHFPMISDEDFN
ncbi:RES domain-containing protein [Paenibacillus sp. NAIST15-1]|uniref:RES domain-containing protein n=1 Tax=Paenibacillus sp. NAIST15-1 TaxID=1605994 RepID=UPI00086C71FC|nr:RES domain-containing protein [Paenibacillus sp. NAIST15-1]GAV15990.1 hypothetical protein PBN151_5975 [Paenibacillus sp. NAIST15-1]